jgi:D-apionolactonase
MTTDAFALYGTHEAEEHPVRLTAGRLSADLANGNLRTIRYDGLEVLRAVSYLVRDRDWGTYSPAIEDLWVEQGKDGFSIRYVARCNGPDDTSLAISVHIAATERELTFKAEALSPTGFETNRCGFCILHPIVGIAGRPARVEHVDCRVAETLFPDQIDPWQPFKDIRAITHQVAMGVSAECRMEGDTFEMEDQRNWSDASYKTYVRPLALPWPYRIAAHALVRQKITLSIHDTRSEQTAATGGPDRTIRLEPSESHGIMPAIGLIVTPDDAGGTLEARDLLSELAPQELLFHFDPNAGHDTQALKDFAAVAAVHSGRSTLEIALPCKQAPAVETAEIARQMESAGFHPDAILISPSVDRQSTPPGSKWPDCPPLEEVYLAARDAFAGIRIGGGMLSYFTELNRKRVPADHIGFVSHCTNPIVHAADDLSVMQTLEALPFITGSVRAIYGDKPYRIGPSTIPMRQNPYGSRTMDNPAGGRIPMANRDPRHNGRFAEAFALGYAIRVLDANLECLTLSALTGPFGLIAGQAEPTHEGGMRPLFNTVKLLCSLAGSSWRGCASSNPSKVLAFQSGATLHVVNLTAEERHIDIKAFTSASHGGNLSLDAFGTTAISLHG